MNWNFLAGYSWLQTALRTAWTHACCQRFNAVMQLQLIGTIVLVSLVITMQNSPYVSEVDWDHWDDWDGRMVQIHPNSHEIITYIIYYNDYHIIMRFFGMDMTWTSHIHPMSNLTCLTCSTWLDPSQDHNRTESRLLIFAMLMVLFTFCFHANDAWLRKTRCWLGEKNPHLLWMDP
jgi:hypothetical protein